MSRSLARPGSGATDRALVREAARGRETALAELFDRYGQTLYSVAFRILKEQAEAEESVLDAFAQAWRDAGRFDQSKGSVAAWLTIMARSRALDRLRARARRDRVTSSAAADEPNRAPAMGSPPDDPSATIGHDETRARVSAALRELPPEQRESIELAYYQGLSHSEIAERLGAPLGTVKTRIRTGMQRLREALRPLFAEEYS